MNTRQTKKHLKKQIDKLRSDNDLMRRIIADSPKMQELYDVYTKPLNNICTTMSLQEFKSKRMIPAYMADVEGIIEHTKQAVAKDLFEGIKENITYEVNAKHRPTSITASIFVGRKRRQAALNSLIDNTHLDGYDLAEALDAIENKEKLPPVTPQPKYGKWIYEKRKRLIDETDEGAEYITDYWCKCSNCDGDFGYRKMKDAFCKYCGAKMIEPQESEE